MSSTTSLRAQPSAGVPETRMAFSLMDPASLWLVRSGALDIFAVSMRNGAATGGLRPLFSVQAGQAVFGIGAEAGGGLSLIAKRGYDTDVIVRPLAATGANADENAEENANQQALLAGWIAALSRVAEEPMSPSAAADRDEAPDAPRDQRRADWHGPALDRFHADALVLIGDRLAQADAVARQRSRQRAVLDGAAMRSALRDLASPVDERARETTSAAGGAQPPDTPLARACQAIGNTLGFAVAPHWRARRGVPAIIALAQASGIRYRGIGLRGHGLTRGSEPLLVFRHRDQAPAALLPRRGRRGYWHYDPQTDTRTPLDATTAATLNPLAFMFYRTFPRQMQLSLREVLKFGLTGSRREWIAMATMSLASGLLALVPPIVVGVLFDSTIPRARREDLLIAGGLLLASALAIALCGLTRGMAILRLQGTLSLTLEAALWDRLLTLPLPFFRRYAAGDLAQRGLAFSQMHATLTGPALSAVLSGLGSLCSVGLLIYYSPALAGVALLLTLVAVLVTIVASALQLTRQPASTGLAGGITGMVVELLKGMAKLRAAGAEARMFARWARAFAAKKRSDLELRRITTWLTTFNAVYLIACVAVLYAANVWLLDWHAHALSTGTFIAFVIAFGQFMSGALAMSSTMVNAASIVPLYARAAPILRTVPEVTRTPAADLELMGEIDVHHLAFRYRPDAPLVLRDLSLHIAAGQFVAIVGPSGCGKSTVLRLLLGFEAPASGSVCYDGTDIARLDVHAMRRQIGVVLQTGGLLAGTIKDNICGMARLGMDEVWEAARLVGLDEAIRAMPMGMQTTVLPDGTGLSGGQRQRLLIARAVARKARVLMFDEATSALDNRTQALVSRRIATLHATRVVIAHRLTTVLDADCILVMDRGRIVQSGTYDELMRTPGLFVRLAQRQVV
jgi:NHLM bacteriocin system ABC transporter ATP-binding protein